MRGQYVADVRLPIAAPHRERRLSDLRGRGRLDKASLLVQQWNVEIVNAMRFASAISLTAASAVIIKLTTRPRKPCRVSGPARAVAVGRRRA